MRLYYGSRTAWTGQLICEIMCLCQEEYLLTRDHASTISNLKNSLTLCAECIWTQNDKRNYRYTIESYFHALCDRPLHEEDQFWQWTPFVLRGRIPYKSGYYTVQLEKVLFNNEWTLALEINHHGKVITWEMDILIAWMYEWNAEMTRIPLQVESRIFCVGEYLATRLFAACGDQAGEYATLDEIQDRGEKWLIS